MIDLNNKNKNLENMKCDPAELWFQQNDALSTNFDICVFKYRLLKIGTQHDEKKYKRLLTLIMHYKN